MNPLIARAFTALSRITGAGASAYRDDFDDVAATYDGVVTRPLLARATEELIERSAIAPGMACLDLGCGTGHSTALMASRTERVIGIDISERMIERARARCAGMAGVRFMVGALPGTLESCSPASFDYAGLFWSMEYLDHGATLRAVHRVLAPRGTVAVLVNLRTSLMELQDLVAPIMLRNIRALKAIPPLNFLPGAAAFEATARAAGFETVECAEETIPVRFATGRELVEWMRTGGPAAGFKSSIREGWRDRIFGKIAAAADRRGGLGLTFRFAVYRGRKP